MSDNKLKQLESIIDDGEIEPLEELIEKNEEYQDDLDKLVDKTSKISEKLEEVMDENNIQYANGWELVKLNHGQWNVTYLTSSENLFITGSIDGYYYAGDFNYWVPEQTVEATLYFLRELDKIVSCLKEELDEKHEDVKDWLDKLS